MQPTSWQDLSTMDYSGRRLFLGNCRMINGLILNILRIRSGLFNSDVQGISFMSGYDGRFVSFEK